MIRNKKGNLGFTLIELMVTLAIGVILTMVAIPSMTTYKRNAELTSATNTLLSAINAARGEAMKRGMNAMVLPVDGTNWSSGWVVFVDTDRSQTYSNNIDSTILAQGSPASYITVTGNQTAGLASPYVLFDSSGYSKTKAGGFGALTLSLARNDVTGSLVYEQTRRIKIANTGRVRTCKQVNSGDTTCSATATD
ncbi:GspH/FimT family pseudopilin [Polaromonas sp. CG_9.11]|uniref:GspH/FimT family pseudopilin n=1 Tax=Polaromonas sp. CG_9.11 TaxID=2787730 RepID=UPI0018CAAC89|nr:GspH/FimT family pseudopilin [Polaromonas sp. CG_9.11]MBG6075502.1 type IV fimbrial biogenesis protein FimT [Polaromonas sp. CG_9.11]